LIGAGGIGSPTALVLGQMGCRALRVSDPDTVGVENLAYQLYPVHAIGRPKVEALSEVLVTFCDLTPAVEQRRVTGDDLFQGVVIVAVDTLAARRDIWRGIRGNETVPLFIDARMGGEIAQIHAIRPADPCDVAYYEGVLRRQPAELPCTAQGISYNVWAIASLLGNLVKRYATGETLPVEIRLDLHTLTLVCWERPANEAEGGGQ
jgi:hypothetical protein